MERRFSPACKVPGCKKCVCCGSIIKADNFEFDKEVCNKCYVDDLREQLDEAKKKRGPGRPRKDSESNS